MRESDWAVRYVTPERGGTLTYQPQIDDNMRRNDTWMPETRRRNRFDQFRQQTAAQFRNLENAVLREIESTPEKRSDHTYTFDTILERVNALVPLVELVRVIGGFEVRRKADGSVVDPEQMSSGESEAISLAIEALVFSRIAADSPNRLLLLDEPDVHLHPDLQVRYVEFLDDLALECDFKVLIATHSTALVGAAPSKEHSAIAFQRLSDRGNPRFASLSSVASSVIPIFGAHPLSSAFNQQAPLILEGDDDVRIWQQVVRSSHGRVGVYPCAAGSKEDVRRWEMWLAEALPALYDDPCAFSLIDRDDAGGQLSDEPPIVRLRLECRAAENLLLAEETLARGGVQWPELRRRLCDWIDDHPAHPKIEHALAFRDSGFDRSGFDLKHLRNILMAEIGVARPWEVLVGQAIAGLLESASITSEHSLRSYLGEKTCAALRI